MLDESAIVTELAGLDGWEYDASVPCIRKRYSFKNFRKAFGFVAEISLIAEKMMHHPDLAFGWGYCVVTIQTHDVGGLTAKDFELARAIHKI